MKQKIYSPLLHSVLFTLSIIIPGFLTAQRPAPGPAQTGSILLLNGTAHIGNGQVLERSAIGFRDGKIVLVEDLSQPSAGQYDFDEVIDIAGKHVYPGFILTNTTLGLREVDAVRATLDYQETGEMKPEVRSVVAYSTDSKLIPTVRRNGILLVQPTPVGGIISGHSGIVHLDAWNWEDAVIRMEDGVHIYWPPSMRIVFPNENEMAVSKMREERLERLKALKDLLERASSYRLRDEKEFNLRCESLKGIFDGTRNVYLHVQTEKDIMESVLYLESIGIKRTVLVGASEGVNILPFIREHGLPVILDRPHSLPRLEDDDVKQPYRMAKIFWDAGILVTISYEGDMDAMGGRNLPFTAGTTVAYGLTREQAVQLITLNAANILGVGQQVGSLETGKDATLFVSSGDALDMITSNVELAYISGRKLTLDSSQEELYEMYKTKYGIK